MENEVLLLFLIVFMVLEYILYCGAVLCLSLKSQRNGRMVTEWMLLSGNTAVGQGYGKKEVSGILYPTVFPLSHYLKAYIFRGPSPAFLQLILIERWVMWEYFCEKNKLYQGNAQHTAPLIESVLKARFHAERVSKEHRGCFKWTEER